MSIAGETALSGEFINTVKSRFGVSEPFLRKLVSKRQLKSTEYDKWEDLTDGTDMDKAYLHFALSSVVRGRQARDFLFEKCGDPGGRYLDIGCAYAGFVVAFAEAGYESIGVEISPEWAELGKLAVTECAGDATVLNENFFELESNEKFSVITCNDVIEHVHWPEKAIKKISELLAPGGYAYFAIPNRKSIRHVLRDGHYGLVAHGLLEHHAAKEYYSYHKQKFDNRDYSCGEMHPFDWYAHKLIENGLQIQRVKKSTSVNIEEVQSIFGKTSSVIESEQDFGACDEKLRFLIKSKYTKYSGQFWEALTKYKLGLPQDFIRDFVDDFWYVVAHKSE